MVDPCACITLRPWNSGFDLIGVFEMCSLGSVIVKDRLYSTICTSFLSVFGNYCHNKKIDYFCCYPLKSPHDFSLTTNNEELGSPPPHYGCVRNLPIFTIFTSIVLEKRQNEFRESQKDFNWRKPPCEQLKT